MCLTKALANDHQPDLRNEREGDALKLECEARAFPLEAGTEIMNKAGTALTNKAGTTLLNDAGVSLTSKAAASQTVDGGGMLTIKGGMVKIN